MKGCGAPQHGSAAQPTDQAGAQRLPTGQELCPRPCNRREDLTKNIGAPRHLALRVLHPGDHASRRGNKALKLVPFLSAFASLKDPACQAYYDRKRSEGKRHNQAPVALARRRCDTLYAMLRDVHPLHPKGRRFDLTNSSQPGPGRAQGSSTKPGYA